MKTIAYEPFDLERVKRGDKVTTRLGKPARIITTDRKGNLPIVALIDNENGRELCAFYMINGRVDLQMDSIFDLVHPAPEMWVNLYQSGFIRELYEDKWFLHFCCYVTGNSVYDTKEHAKNNIITDDTMNYRGTYRLVKE